MLALAVLWMWFDARSPWADFLRTERKHMNLNHTTISLKFLINVHSGYSHMIQSPLSALSVQRRSQYSENPQVSWDWEKALNWCIQPSVLISCRNRNVVCFLSLLILCFGDLLDHSLWELNSSGGIFPHQFEAWQEFFFVSKDRRWCQKEAA